MKKFILIILIVIVAIIVWRFVEGFLTPEVKRIVTKPFAQSQSISPTPETYSSLYSLFVPYWKLSDQTTDPIDTSKFDKRDKIYFGVQADTNGIDRNDIGFTTLTQMDQHQNTYQILTLRMLNNDINLKLIEDKSFQTRLIQQTVDTALDFNFKEILLDFEISTLPLAEVQNGISTFAGALAQKSHENNLQFDMTIYGDTFYRARPFDLTTLEPFTDRFYIMFYDLHKPAGEPGPNFPLKGKETYGTDLQTTITSFLKIIPPHKIVPIFGLYGYDWIVDENKNPIQRATSLPYADIKKGFLDSCVWKNCTVTRDPISKETEIDYIDAVLLYHVIWFEDKQSIEEKENYLQSIGIKNAAIWVWGYY